ncbi:MAG: T9SS type A sorting domain-containing protein [candidate division WOR-3 bacterium]
MASNHRDYLVVWFGVRLSGDVVLASRVDNDGVIIDSVPFEISTDTVLLNQLAVSSDGENYLVVWTTQTPDTIGLDLVFKRIAIDGSILDTIPHLIARNHNGIYKPAISFSGGCYLVVWNQEDNIFGCRILPDGTVLDSNGFSICVDTFQQLEPAISSDGHRFFVTWTDNRNDNYDIYGVFVDSLANVSIIENISSLTNNHFNVNISPNPFTSKINIKNNSEINFLKIYDISGKLVKSFTNASTQIIWDGENNQGQIVPNGVYLLELQSNNNKITRRVIKLK